jgi:mannose-1-phosphate guanylyltransferase/mannose-1-phosphate guanylyltransferase/phosphomannomutase
MIEVGGEPLLHHHLRMLAAAGAKDVALNLHHLPEVIRDEAGDGAAFGCRIRYSVEKDLLGSAGALNGFPGFFDETFFVLYGDVYHEIDLGDLARFHAQRRAILTMSATTAEDPTTKGVLSVDETGRVHAFVEKPPVAPRDAAVNAGVYVCEPRVAALVPPGSSDFGSDLIPGLIATDEPVYALSTPALVQDIGTPEGLAKARALASRVR